MKTHLALKKLVDIGKVSCVMTENNDGLHSLAGFKKDTLFEFQGNRMTEYCYKCDSSVMRHFIINDAIRKCVACGSNLSSRITKGEIKKLTTKAMFYTLDSTVFISLGNDMNHRSKPSSSMVAMSSHMGKGNLYTVSN